MRRGGALLRPRRQGKAAALPCPPVCLQLQGGLPSGRRTVPLELLYPLVVGGGVLDAPQLRHYSCFPISFPLVKKLTARILRFLPCNSPRNAVHLRQYRIILSADTASEVRQLLSQKRR